MSGNKRVCKLEAAFKSMEQQKRNAFLMEYSGDGKSSSGRSIAAAGEMKLNTIRTGLAHDEKRQREGEKAACLFHLIFWGPN